MSGNVNVNQLKETIKNLDKETLVLLIETLGKVQKKKTKAKAKVIKKPVKKRGRPKKNVAEKEIRAVDAEFDLLDSEDSDDINSEEAKQPIGQKPRKIKKLQPRKHGDKGSPGRVEPFQAIKNRPNLFLKSKLFNAHKNDVEVDKKLNSGRKPTERGERNNLVEVECNLCEKTCVVQENLIYMDPEEGPRYTCDQCMNKKRD